MKKFLYFLAFISFLALSSTVSSCSTKTGCPINEEAHVKPDKKGRLSAKRGRSNLFPKDMRKKKKK